MKDASSWISEIRYKRDRGVPLNVRVSIDDMWNAYLETLSSGRGLAPGTHYGYRKKYLKYIEPFFRNIDMTTLSNEAHERFINWLKTHKISTATVNRIRSLTQAIYSKAIKKKKFNGIFKENPYQFIEKQEENRPEIEYWNREEVTQFLEATKETPHYPLWVLILNTGLRIGEAVALQRCQVDMTADILCIDRLFCKQSKQILMRPKGKLTRYIGLKQRRVVRETLYPILPKEGLIFKNENGGVMNPRILLQWFLPKYCKAAGVKNIGLHGMRHTFAANFMMAGGNIWDLSKELGHSTVELTNKHYAHFSQNHTQERGGVVEFGSGKVIKVEFGK